MRWNGWRTAAVAALAGAIAVGAYGVARGDVHVALLLFIPVVYGTGGLGLLAVLLTMSAFVLWTIGTMKAFAGAAREHVWTGGGDAPNPFERRGDASRGPFEAHEREDARTPWPNADERGGKRSRVRGGGVIMLGPIPIVFGSDKKAALWVVLATLALMIVAFLFLAL